MSEALILAVPSKGRLRDQAAAALGKAGLSLDKPGGSRNYRGRLRGLENSNAVVEIAFLSAAEIARELAAGRVHLGITGEDLVRECLPRPERHIELVRPLGFGHADVVVAVPQLWIDVWTMADLDDVAAGFLSRVGRRLRIATKYWNLTQGFFASHGIALYRIVESLGATEGAPAAGTADLIVDITTTGSTLAANHLKVLDDGVILHSEANLARAVNASWSGPLSRTADDLITTMGG